MPATIIVVGPGYSCIGVVERSMVVTRSRIHGISSAVRRSVVVSLIAWSAGGIVQVCSRVVGVGDIRTIICRCILDLLIGGSGGLMSMTSTTSASLSRELGSCSHNDRLHGWRFGSCVVV